MTVKFTEEHEWLKPEGELVVVGITEHAAEALGEIVFVELPDAGTAVSKNEEIVVIESVKAASDILAPLDGEIVEVNGALIENPSLINEDAMEAAWFFKMKLNNASDMDTLLDESAYKALIA
ncbi:MAG: glycine cleavage system protein H [Rhodobacteraceae bacterium]|nr:MAG: glycine cleavage system protein H [Paracoccaceae bacterium]